MTVLEGRASMRAAPRPVSLTRAWRAERAKVRRSWFLMGAVLLSIFAQVLGIWTYRNNEADFAARGHNWLVIWVEGAILVTGIFMPLLFVVILAFSSSQEFQLRGWQRLVSVNRAKVAVRAKMLLALELAATAMFIHLCTAIAAGLIMGFDPSRLGPYFARFVCAVFGAWAVAAVTLALGTVFRTFAAISAVGLVATIIGLALTAAAPPLAAIFPFTQISLGLGSRAGADIGSPSTMIPGIVVSLFWVALSTLVCNVVIRRREW